MRAVVGLWLLLAVTLVALARSLPARAFFAGDSGVKLIVARSAIAHPTRPLDVDLPVIDGRPIGLMDPFFSVGDRSARATTSDLFPLVSAPLIRLFGLRGAYILPGLGFLLFVAAIPWLGLALDPRRSPFHVMLMAAAGTPVFFYGLEFWEHALAIGIAAVATAVLVDPRRRSPVRAVLSGVLFGLALLLRPEALLFVAAVMLSLPLLQRPFVIRDGVLMLIGVALACAPLVMYSIVHSGQVFGVHVTNNMTGLFSGWLAERSAIMHAWFGLPDAASRGAFPPSTIWRVAPVAVCLCFVVVSDRRGRRFLYAVALLTTVFVCLTAPNDGGAQWGPRYLLFAFIPIAILGADGLEATAQRFGHWGAAVALLLVVTSLFIQRSAYRELRNTKRIYERVVDFVEARTSECQYVVTDLWWLDQVVAALYPSRTFLVVDSPDRAREAFTRLRESRVAPVCVVRASAESSTAVEDWAARTGFVPAARHQIAEPALSLVRFQLP